MKYYIEKLIEDKIETDELNAKDLVYTLLKYVSDENIEKAISNNTINISEKELMDYKKNYSDDKLIFFKDFIDFRIEIKQNANGYFYRIILNDNNSSNEEIYNSSYYYEYFETTDAALSIGKLYLTNIYFNEF